MPIVEKLLLPYQKIPSNQDAYLIDELLEVASLVDQPTPYLETLAHCLHEKNEEDFHKNIAFFQPLGTGTLWRQELKKSEIRLNWHLCQGHNKKRD